MAKFELKLPKMGESVAEATVTNWLKNVGDKIEVDEAVLEIATDKVDSEVPSEVSGTLTEILFQVNDVVKVGQTIAIIETEGVTISATTSETITETVPSTLEVSEADAKSTTDNRQLSSSNAAPADFKSSDKFYSPLVKNIATAEGISLTELESIAGSGKDGRVTKEDVLKHIAIRQKPLATSVTVQTTTDNRQPTTDN